MMLGGPRPIASAINQLSSPHFGTSGVPGSFQGFCGVCLRKLFCILAHRMACSARSGQLPLRVFCAKPQAGESNGMTRLLTTEEVAEITGISPETLAQWRWLKKEIPFVRLSRKCVRYRQSDIDAWLDKRLVSVTSEQTYHRR